MQRQNDEVRYKLINPNSEGPLPKGMADMKIKHGYTHGNNSKYDGSLFVIAIPKQSTSPTPFTPPKKKKKKKRKKENLLHMKMCSGNILIRPQQ